MTVLGIGPSPDDYNDRRSGGEQRRVSDRKGINWPAIGVITALTMALFSWFGAGFSDYRRVNDRVLTLENQRVEDKARLERIEGKVDRLLEQRK